MPYQPSKRSIRIEQDRLKSADLLKVYGCLLTPKQYAMTAGYCLQGKSFSQIAREQNVSRQAVHEAVRSVQRSLSEYDEKLGLLANLQNPAAAAACSTSVPVMQVLERLESLKGKVTQRGIIYSSDWIVQELNEAIQVLESQANSAGRNARPEAGREVMDGEKAEPVQSNA